LWKQDIDRIEFWNDMTHDQVGAQIIGQDVPLSQSLVRGGAKVSTYQDWSLELHGYSRTFTTRASGISSQPMRIPSACQRWDFGADVL
jgi:hypothetical protein